MRRGRRGQGGRTLESGRMEFAGGGGVDGHAVRSGRWGHLSALEGSSVMRVLLDGVVGVGAGIGGVVVATLLLLLLLVVEALRMQEILLLLLLLLRLLDAVIAGMGGLDFRFNVRISRSGFLPVVVEPVRAGTVLRGRKCGCGGFVVLSVVVVDHRIASGLAVDGRNQRNIRRYLMLLVGRRIVSVRIVVVVVMLLDVVVVVVISNNRWRLLFGC